MQELKWATYGEGVAAEGMVGAHVCDECTEWALKS